MHDKLIFLYIGIIIYLFTWGKSLEYFILKKTHKKINLILGDYKNINILYLFFLLFSALFGILIIMISFDNMQYIIHNEYNLSIYSYFIAIMSYIFLLLSILSNNKNYNKIEVLYYGEKLVKISNEYIKRIERKIPYRGWKKILILDILTIFIYHYYILIKGMIYSINKKYNGYKKIILKIFTYILSIFLVLLIIGLIINIISYIINIFIIWQETSIINELIIINILLTYIESAFLAMILSIIWFLIDKFSARTYTIMIIIGFISIIIFLFNLSVKYIFLIISISSIIGILSIYTFILSFEKLAYLQYEGIKNKL